jgi:hypothetical protein
VTLTIDHVVVAVPDLDRAAAAWTSAGFVVTPRADHPFGTSNRLVVFEQSYVEIVSVTRPDLLPTTGFAADVADRLAQGDPGITHLALHTDDAATEARSRGAEVFQFSRPAPMLDGTTRQASFSLVMLDGRGRPGLFFCRHHTPEAVWAGAHFAHANGARRLMAAVLTAPAPETLAEPIAGSRFDSVHDAIETDGDHEPFEVGTVVVRAPGAAS